MWEETMKVAVSNGIFAVLFCSLLVYELRITGKRESKYQSVIEGLAQSLTSLKEVVAHLESIERLLAGSGDEEEDDGEKCCGERCCDKTETFCPDEET